MRAECPNCYTSYVIDNILPKMSQGTIVCAVCIKSFDVTKHKTWLQGIKIKTKLIPAIDKNNG